MKTKSKKLSDTRVLLTVTLDAKELKEASEKALNELAKEIRVEGFRKGKTPVEVAKKFIPENDLNAKTIDFAVRATMMEAFKEAEKSPLAMPDVSVTKFVPGEMAEYTAEAEVLPEIKLCDYKKLTTKPKATKIAKKDIDGVLDNLKKSFAEKKAVKREAANGDEAVIDFVGKKDGVEFPGGTGNDFPLTLGSETFIPGFEEGIVGHKAGDSFTLELTFPKDYGTPSLAGAKTTFDVVLKKVNEIKEPELDDKLAKKVGPFKTLDELKEDIEKNLKAQTEHQNAENFKNDLVEEIVKKSKIGAPEILIHDQLHFINDDLARNAASVGMTLDEYLDASGEDPKEFDKKAHELAEMRVKTSLALQKIALDEKITVSDEEVDAKIAELRDVYRKSPEAMKSLKDPNVKMDIKNRMVIEKTLDYLVKISK